jgi:hypothetical protein
MKWTEYTLTFGEKKLNENTTFIVNEIIDNSQLIFKKK